MNRITFLIFSLFLVSSISSFGQSEFTLAQIIERAQAQSPLAKQAETRKENRFWQYKLFKSNYNPQLRLSGSAPAYNKDFFSVRQEDGTLSFRSRTETNSNLNLGLNQPIAITGGNISINSGLNVYNDIDRKSEDWNSTMFNLRLDQPIFGFNQLRWDKQTEPLKYEESRRGYVEEMEFTSSQAVDRFFAYMDGQINLQIAKYNLANNDTIYKIEEGRYNIGTTSKDKLLQVELQLLRSKQDVAQANLDLETAKLQLQSFLGFSGEEEFVFMLPELLPEFTVNMNTALENARTNRADFIAFERRKLEAEREVARARGERFEVNLIATYGLNNQAPQFQDVYANSQDQQRVNLTFNVPIVDWGRNKARMKTALANKRLNDYVIIQDEQNFEQEVMTKVRQFTVLRSQVEITKASDRVAQERYSVAQNRYLIGKIDITNLNIALTEKDNAKRSYVNALRSFWGAYYDLRRLTLYDFANNQLLYNPELE